MEEKELLETQEKIRMTLLNSDGSLNINNLSLQLAQIQLAIRNLEKK